MTSTAAPPGGGERNWWTRTVFALKQGARDQLNLTPRSPAAAAPQHRRFKPGVWLQSGWMSTAPVRSKWRWGSLSYIATTWEEERPCLLLSDPNVASSPTRAKADPSTGSPLLPCDLSGQEGQGEYAAIGASRSPVLRRRVPQGLLVGAIVAVAVYAIYRVRRKPRGPRRRNGRPRRRWWHCGAGAGKNGGGDEHCSGGNCGGSVDGDCREGDGDSNPDPLSLSPAPTPASTPASTPAPIPTPVPDINPELHANPEAGEHIGCNGDGPASRTRELSFKSDSSTDDFLADIDSLIAATPAEPPGYRKVSGAEVDALVNLTRRALRREPDALHEIAEDAASKGVAPSGKRGPFTKDEVEDSASFRDGGADDLTPLKPDGVIA